MTLLMDVAMAMPGVVRVGALRVPVFGVFAAVGLVAALWLSQRTAKAAGVDANKLWDAGMFAVATAFVVSRVLLVVMDVRAFLVYPLLVLSLPSLTYGGIAITGVLVWWWLRWKKMPVLRVMDAWAPCAMVLWAALSVGHFVEGTDAGMPTKMPWGVVTAGDHVLGKVHPVQLYMLGAAIYLLVRSMQLLQRSHDAGVVAGRVLRDAGILYFFLDMFAQPTDAIGGVWIDPGQVVALLCFATGMWWTSRWLFANPPQREIA
jgi:phosphatidylglycerol:prolipoprotein diacylglycerol transferase